MAAGEVGWAAWTVSGGELLLTGDVWSDVERRELLICEKELLASNVGLLTLGGLVTKNAILIVDFANHERMAGVEKLDAIRNGAIARLRPVLMTTGATVLGHFPLVLVTGAGAEARNSIGAVLVFGMLIGTLFTLVILPAIYAVLASNRDMTKDIATDSASLEDNQTALA